VQLLARQSALRTAILSRASSPPRAQLAAAASPAAPRSAMPLSAVGSGLRVSPGDSSLELTRRALSPLARWRTAAGGLSASRSFLY
jgi:hypothetical protein